MKKIYFKVPEEGYDYTKFTEVEEKYSIMITEITNQHPNVENTMVLGKGQYSILTNKNLSLTLSTLDDGTELSKDADVLLIDGALFIKDTLASVEVKDMYETLDQIITSYYDELKQLRESEKYVHNICCIVNPEEYKLVKYGMWYITHMLELDKVSEIGDNSGFIYEIENVRFYMRLVSEGSASIDRSIEYDAIVSTSLSYFDQYNTAKREPFKLKADEDLIEYVLRILRIYNINSKGPDSFFIETIDEMLANIEAHKDFEESYTISLNVPRYLSEEKAHELDRIINNLKEEGYINGVQFRAEDDSGEN